MTEDLKNVCLFVTEYAEKILTAGATTERCERVLTQIASVYGTDIEISILPRTVSIELTDKVTGETVSRRKTIKAIVLNFHRLYKLSELSKETVSKKMTLAESEKAFRRILSYPRMKIWQVTLLTGLANASFCRLFGGDMAAMIGVFVATVCGFMLKNELHANLRCDIRLATLLAATSSSVIASATYFTGYSVTADTALGTSVLYLVPGILYINAVSDFINGYLLCAGLRMFNACVLTACLGLGLSVGILLMNVDYF